MRPPIPFATAALLAALLAAPALAQPQAVAVGTVSAVVRPVTKSSDFVGRIDAIERVDIRARVKGFLQAVLFKEGDTVHEGDPLYRIEQEPFQAAVQQAQGALVQAQATFANASLQRARAEELVKTSAASVATRDQRVAEEQTAQGQVISADADLKTAKINLGYTEITAPITGKIGRTVVTKGNVVGPDSGVLTTIVSQDPMFVTFPVSQREFLQIQQEETKPSHEDLLVRIRFANGTEYGPPGKIDFVDVTVDRATDTLIVRARVPNPDGMLVDGQFVRVSVQAGKPDEKIVVPQSALISDQEGIYVFVVDDGKAAVKRIRPGAEIGRDIVVESGLSPGDQVVVEGIQSLRPGAAVTAHPAAAALTAG